MAARAGAKRKRKAKPAEPAGADEAELARLAARVATAMRAEEVAIYDLRGIADFTDFFVVATAAAATQRRSIVRAIERKFAGEGRRPLGVEGLDAGWTLLDFGGCLVHLFSPELRAYYDLDLLWGDCPRVDWEAT